MHDTDNCMPFNLPFSITFQRGFFESKKANRKGASVSVRGHNFEPKQYAQVTHCNHSHEMIWGVAPQGYHCSRE